MAEQVAALEVRLQATLAKFEAQMRRANKSFGNAANKIDRRAGRLSKSVSDNFARMGKRAAVAIAAAFTVRTFDNAISKLDAIGKTADKVGLTTDALQELRFAAERSGVGVNTLDMAMQRFSRRVGEARVGAGEAKDALKEMGVALVDSNGNARANEAILRDVADALSRTEDPAERLRLAFKLFDSEGAALVNMLRDGSAGLDRFQEAAHRANAVVGEDLVRSGEAARDAIDTLSTAFSSTFVSAIGMAAGALIEFFEIGKLGKIRAIESEIESVTETLNNQRRGVVENPWDKINAGTISALESRLAALKAARAAIDDEFRTLSPVTEPTGSSTPASRGGGGGGRSVDDSARRLLEQLRERSRALDNEIQLVGKSAEEHARLAANFDRLTLVRELEAAAAKDKSTITPKEIEEAKQLAFQIEQQTVALALKEDAMRRLEDQEREALDRQRDLADAVRTTSERMISAVQSADSFADALKRIGFEILSMTAEGFGGQGPLAGVLGGVIGGLFGGVTGKAGGSFVKSAKGNVFNRGNVIPFAKGGVVNGPATFPMPSGLGLMGEAGPEAIMPLKRGPGGRLGVQAAGGGGVQVIQYNTFEGVNAATRAVIQQELARQKAEIMREVPSVAAAGMARRPGLRG